MAAREGLPIPSRIANPPELLPGLDVYLKAFFDLDSERQIGETLQQIPWSKIQEYADRYGFDDEGRDDLLFFVRKQDTFHLDRLRAKRSSPIAKKGKLSHHR